MAETKGYWFQQGAGSFGNELEVFVNSELRSGDVVFFWASQAEPGLLGWGIANAYAAPNAPLTKASASRTAYRVTPSLRLDRPIPARQLATAPGLSDAPLIRQTQTGTFFRLSAEQAFELCEALRAAGHEAPHIASSDVLEPIARRVERELIGLDKLLPDLVPSEVARPLSEVASATASRLSSGGLLNAYESLKALIDSLGGVVSSAQGERASLLAPLSAARTRLMNDVFQIARLTDASERVAAGTHAARAPTGDAGAQPADAGAGAGTQPAGAPSTDVDAPIVEPGVRDAAPHPARDAPGAQSAPAFAPPPNQTAAPLAPPKDPLFQYWEQRDLIGIGAAVNNLARYISHEGLLPPVAIGVFGDWGSGKSFFIRALQSQIALLSSQSRDALTDNRTTVFCSHIVQIEFNAWHFVESNLWASLAAHIFERLYVELERRAETEGANQNIDGLYQQFSAYKQAVAEQERLTTLVDVLADKRDQAQQKKQTAEKSVRARLLALTDVVKQNVDELAKQKLTDDERKRLADLLHASNIEDLNAAADEAIAIAREGRGLFGRMKVQLSWWGAWQLALFAVLASVLVFGLPLLLPWLLSTRADELQRLVTLFGGYAAGAAVFLGYLARGGRKLVTAARKVESVLTDVRTRVESASDPQLDAAKRDLAAAQAELTLIDQQVADQRNRLAELADELDPNQLGSRLQAFLEARVKNDQYQKHLGLVSLVRKDFTSLYELMQKYWQQRKRPVPEVLAEVRNALGEAAEASVPFIERIVLYIDDLDRCPEDKVVEVLQAVHLMLGLPLFVVVVAVDVRWVGESIRKHYGKLVGWDEENPHASADIASASADDYLEKIFQIPYRIHPMEPDVRKLLLGGLLRQPYMSATTGAQPPPIIQQALVPKELQLYPEEQKTIEELYAAVGSSPRRVRRFLDVYRLMRAGMEEGDVQELIAKKHYNVILALFAMLSGAPITAPRLIELLRAESLRAAGPNALLPSDLGTWHVQALQEKERPREEMDVIGHAMTYIDALKFTHLEVFTILRRWIPEIARYSFREVRMQRL